MGIVRSPGNTIRLADSIRLRRINYSHTRSDDKYDAHNCISWVSVVDLDFRLEPSEFCDHLDEWSCLLGLERIYNKYNSRVTRHRWWQCVSIPTRHLWDKPVPEAIGMIDHTVDWNHCLNMFTLLKNHA